MNKTTVRSLTMGAVIAALYTAFTFAFSFMSFGAIQFRVAEALCVLPVFFPPAVPGLAVGCLISNVIGVSMGLSFPADIVVGTLATLFAALLTRKTRGVIVKGLPLLSLSFPVIFNAIFVGAELTYFLGDPFYMNVLWVGLGELAVCYGLGIPLAIATNKISAKFFQ
ncbi:MAG: QueT transporter family protein [Oscillospiraceae bacterium]|jgi:uncharacterized membrane protein|nr:QueT transporter family protein [Oscillospiraceae bacterium]